MPVFISGCTNQESFKNNVFILILILKHFFLNKLYYITTISYSNQAVASINKSIAHVIDQVTQGALTLVCHPCLYRVITYELIRLHVLRIHNNNYNFISTHLG